MDIIVEPTDESVSGVGESICSKADELQAAAVSERPGMLMGRAEQASQLFALLLLLPNSARKRSVAY